MCLTACKIRTEKLKAKTGPLTVYKAYRKSEEDKVLYAPYYSASKNGTIRGPVEIVSTAKTANVRWKDNIIATATDNGDDDLSPGAEIETGIHVYLSRSDAAIHAGDMYENGVVVALQADYADLRGVSPEDKADPDYDSHAVFTKVTLTENQWNKLFPLTAEEKAARRSAASFKSAATKKRKAAGRSAAARKAAQTRAANKKARG